MLALAFILVAVGLVPCLIGAIFLSVHYDGFSRSLSGPDVGAESCFTPDAGSAAQPTC